MAIKAANPLDPIWYVPKSDRDSENPTRFRIKGLDEQKKGYVIPELTFDPVTGRATNISGKGVDIALTHGLLDWENLANDKGPLRFSQQNMSLVPYDVRVELALEILTMSELAEEARKN